MQKNINFMFGTFSIAMGSSCKIKVISRMAKKKDEKSETDTNLFIDKKMKIFLRSVLFILRFGRSQTQPT